MNENQVASLRSALLFAADKYRRAADVTNRFADPLTDQLRETERRYRGLAAQAENFDGFAQADVDACIVAVSGCVDDLNRKVQLLNGRYQLQDAAIASGSLRDLYEITPLLTSPRVTP